LGEEKSNYSADNYIGKIVDVEINSRPANRYSEKEKAPTPSSKRKSEYTKVGQSRTGVAGRKGMIFIFIK
jgi:hypothetical protein